MNQQRKIGSQSSAAGPLKFGLNIVAKKDKILKSKPELFVMDDSVVIASGGNSSRKQTGNQ